MRLGEPRLIVGLTLLVAGLVWLGRGSEPTVSAIPLACSQPPANQTDVALCDDFETAPPPDFAFCADRFGFADRCAARTSARLTFSGLRDVYVRWYQYISTPQEGVFPNASVTLSDAANTLVVSTIGLNHQDEGQGGIFLDAAKWYLFEWHVTLNSPGMADGVAELWIDDTTLPIGPQTLRMRRTDMRWLGPDDEGKRLEVLRLTARGCEATPDACRASGVENQVGPLRWDRVVVSRSAIGPLSLPPPPGPPTGLRIVSN